MQLWIIALLAKLLLVFYFINLSSSQWTFNNNNNNDEYDVNSGWIKVPLKYPSHNYFRRSAQAALDEYSSLNNNNNNNNNENTEESGRHFKPETIFKITETLGALNTVGRYLVNITRSGESGKVSKDVPNALYTISKNVLGRNVTDTLAPLVMDALPLKKDKPDRIIQKLDKISKEEEELDDDDDDDDDDEDSKGCKTPEGLNGHCSDLSFCPQLLLNLEHLRRSFCFRTLYQPGVCCPKAATENNHHHQNHQIISTTTTTTTTQATTTKRTLPITFDSIYYNTDNPVSIISTTSKPFSSSSTVSTSAIIAANTPLYHLPPSLPAVVNNFVDPLDCGQPESAKYRVVGGEEALPGRWPWMAAIFLHGSKRTEFWCGGSLISTSHILTAAHCTRDSRQRPFSARQFTVRLGDIDLKRDDEPSSPVTYKVTEIRAHKQFSRVGFYNDIAILKLDRPVRKSKYIIPLCLPSGEIRQEKFAGKRSTVVGWGTTYYGGKESTIQRQAGLPIWRNEDCNQAYFQPITSNFICAGYTEGGTDACQGDSGGPLMLKWDTRWIQIGVVSFGNKCGEPGYPGVYTRITEYLDWIKENTRT